MRHLILLLVLCATTFAQPGDLIANGDFSANADGWSTYFAPGQAKGSATWQPRGEGDGYLRVTVNETSRDSAVQIWRGPFTILRGQRYLVSFEARAAESIALPVHLMRNEAPYSTYGLDADVPVGPQWQTYELIATASADSDVARLDFFGVGSFDLDNVSLRPAPPVELRPPARVTLGPGWQGTPQALLDEDPKTEISSASYAPVPLFVIAELARPAALRQVVVGSRDSGDYVLTYGMGVEVDDGQGGWRHWARASKRATGEQRTEFGASSLAATTSRFRLRVDNVKNVSWLTSLRIETGEVGAAPATLPLIPPADDLAFVGWDYDRLGYDWTPGERLALRWRNHGDRPAEVPLSWQLDAYLEDTLAAGDGALSILPGAEGSLTVPVPSEAPDGGATVRITFAKEQGGTSRPFYVDLHRAPEDPLKLRIVALFDNNDPEGWVQLLAGPLAPYLEVSADWPADGQVDAILVQAARWPEGDDRLDKLAVAVKAGTPALVYGEPLPAIAEWLPAETAGWLPDRGVLAGDWITARRHRVGLVPRAGARVMMHWTDQQPAVVTGEVGLGKVAQFGTGSGQTWLRDGRLAATDALTMRVLYELCGKAAALDTWLAQPQPDLGQPNVGRFGWKLTEGGLVENLQEDGTVTCPADPSRPWHPVHPAFDGPPRVIDRNWIAKTMAWSRGGQEAIRATLSMASPYVLWESRATELEFPLTATSEVYRGAGDQMLKLVAGEPTAGLAEGWLLVVDTDAARADVPRLVILQRRPRTVEIGSTLKLTFEGPAGAFWTGRPLGLHRGATRDQAVMVGRAELRNVWHYPVDCVEAASVDGDRVTVRDQFVYRSLQPEWPVAAETASPLPPVLALARQAGAPLDLGGAQPTGCATKYGPLLQVAGESITYTIDLPRREPFGAIPTTGDEPLREAIDHYGLQGTGSVTRASGGMSANGPFNADLLTYASSSRYANPYEAPCIDLYKWWYCFPAVQGRPAYGAAARQTIDEHYRTHYADTLNRYGYKCFVRQRREPRSKIPYTISFVWPTMVQDGVRYFVDQNESAAVIAECLDAWARYYGDWDTVAANWNLVRSLYDYLPKFHDWAWMASSNQEFFSVAGIDMLNSEYPGNLAYAEMARQLGRNDEATEATILAAKALVPAVARLAMPEYVKAMTVEGDPWRNDRFYYSFDEFGLRGMPSIVMRGGPESIMDLAIGMLDTSKGTTPEMTLAYREWSGELTGGYEQALVEAQQEHSRPVGWAHLMQRAILGWPKAELLKTAAAFHALRPNFGWQSTKAPSNLAVVQASGGDLFLSEWLPAGYVTGRYEPAANRAVLQLTNDQPAPIKLRLFSRRAVTGLTVNGVAATFAYEAKTGWLTAEIVGQSGLEVVVSLGERLAVRHPYLGDVP